MHLAVLLGQHPQSGSRLATVCKVIARNRTRTSIALLALVRGIQRHCLMSPPWTSTKRDWRGDISATCYMILVDGSCLLQTVWIKSDWRVSLLAAEMILESKVKLVIHLAAQILGLQSSHLQRNCSNSNVTAKNDGTTLIGISKFLGKFIWQDQ